MIKSLSEYRVAVQQVLAPFGRTESEKDIVSGYEDYISCVEILGDAVLIAEQGDEGDVRVFVKAPKGQTSKTASVTFVD